MWEYNENTNKFTLKKDKTEKEDFNLIREELDSYRFYSKCLRGTTYMPIKSKSDIHKKLRNKKSPLLAFSPFTNDVDVPDNFIITEDGFFIIDENGNFLIQES